MTETIISIISDGLLYGGTAVILTLSAREFQYYNLAAGVWVIVGGWVGSALSSQLMGSSSIPITTYLLFLTLCGGIAFYLGTIWVMRERLIKSPLAFLLVSLGIALLLSAIIPAYVLTSFSATIPNDYQVGPVYLLVFVLFCVFLVAKLFRTPIWANTVVQFRRGKSESGLWKRIVALLLIEIVLLLVLGYVGAGAHKGVFASSEFRTLIPILAIIIAQSHPYKAALYCFLIVALGHVLVSYIAPALGVFALGEYATAITLMLLIVIVLVRFWRRDGLTIAPQLPVANTRLSWGFDLLKEKFIWQLVVAFAMVILFFLLQESFSLISSEDFGRALLFAGLATAAWVMQRYLGIFTITIYAVGVCATYALVTVGHSWILVVAFLAIVAIVWVAYLIQLRVISNEAALVVDLSCLSFLHQSVINTAYLTGADNIRMLPFGYQQITSPEIEAIVQMLILAILLSISVYYAGSPHGRAKSLALMNLRQAWANGFIVRRIFAELSVILVLLSMACSLAYHFAVGYVVPTSLSIETGLAVMLLGYLMEMTTPLSVFIIIFAIYGVLSSTMAGTGSLLTAAMGLLFMFSPMSIVKTEKD